MLSDAPADHGDECRGLGLPFGNEGDVGAAVRSDVSAPWFGACVLGRGVTAMHLEVGVAVLDHGRGKNLAAVDRVNVDPKVVFPYVAHARHAGGLEVVGAEPAAAPRQTESSSFDSLREGLGDVASRVGGHRAARGQGGARRRRGRVGSVVGTVLEDGVGAYVVGGRDGFAFFGLRR